MHVCVSKLRWEQQVRLACCAPIARCAALRKQRQQQQQQQQQRCNRSAMRSAPSARPLFAVCSTARPPPHHPSSSPSR